MPIGKPSGKNVNVHTLFTPEGNGIDVVVLMDSIRAISERFANTAYGFFLGKKVAHPVVANYVRNTRGKYGLVRSMFSSFTGLFSFQFSSMNGLNAMLENGPWFIWNNPLIMKKWHPDENLLNEDVSTVPVWVKLYGVPVTAFSEDGLSVIATKLGAGEKKTVKKPSQTSQGVPVGLKMDFKPHKEYCPVPKTSTASFSAGNPLKKVKFLGEYNSEDEVASVDNDMARSMAYERVGFGTEYLMEQWRDSYSNGDFNDDPYNDDMYEGQDLSHELQAICDNLDIRLRCRKKK
nr:hypothetical protein [Tanacetum cinerariifolium]